MSIDGVFDDPDGENANLSYSVESSDDALATVTLSGTDLTIRGVAVGTPTVTVTAEDSAGDSVTDTFTVTVSPANQPPTVDNEIPDQAVTVGATTTVSIDGVFDDPDGENANLSYSVESSDDALATVTLSGTDLTIRGVAVGTPTVTVTADDGEGGSVTDTFTVTVSPPNQPPTVDNEIPDQAVTVGATTTVSIDGVFDDPDGDNANLSYSVASSDDALATVTLNGTDLTIRGVAVGTPTVTVTAEDSAGDSVTDTFTVTVSPHLRSRRAELPGDDPEPDLHPEHGHCAAPAPGGDRRSRAADLQPESDAPGGTLPRRPAPVDAGRRPPRRRRSPTPGRPRTRMAPPRR